MRRVVALARLFATNPASFVLATIFPNELTLAVTFILLELSDILLAIGPHEVTLSVHFVVHPVSVVNFVV
jgi:hypothetical protein